MKPTIFKNKKGLYGLEHLPELAVVFLVTGVVFALALIVLATLQTNSIIAGTVNSTGGTFNPAGFNAAANKSLANSITAVGEIPNNWLDLIAIVVAAAFLVTITVAGMMYSFGAFNGGMNGGSRR